MKNKLEPAGLLQCSWEYLDGKLGQGFRKAQQKVAARCSSSVTVEDLFFNYLYSFSSWTTMLQPRSSIKTHNRKCIMFPRSPQWEKRTAEPVTFFINLTLTIETEECLNAWSIMFLRTALLLCCMKMTKIQNSLESTITHSSSDLLVLLYERHAPCHCKGLTSYLNHLEKHSFIFFFFL